MMIQTFQELDANQQTAAGGKGSTLAQLYQAGYPVPDGFIILPTAFDGDELQPQAWNQIQQHLARFRNGRSASFAIRSSATSEDAALTSFAGEFETVLNAQTDADIRHAIYAVHQSRQSARVQAYSQAQGVTGIHHLAIIVQQMVTAEWAGVLFTADPVTGSHTHMVGNYVSGLGEQLVSGEVDPHTFTLQRPKGRYDGPDELKRYGRRLFKLARRLEADLGGPQDIEWAIAAGKLTILQSRPITTLQAYNPATGMWNDSWRGHYLWTNANFGEAVPDVMTPLTWSLLQIYGQETFGLPLPGDHPLFGNVGGRLYMNVSLFTSLMRALGLSHKRIQYEAEEFFGYIPKDIDLPIIPFSRWRIIRLFLGFAFQARKRLARNQAGLATFTAALPEQCRQFHRQIKEASTTAGLLTLWQEQLRPTFQQACQMLQAGTSRFENPARKLRHELTEKVGQEDANALMSGFNLTSNQLASLGPVIGLWQVTQNKLSRQAYAQQYGHRSAHEFEVSWLRPAEDPGWIDAQLSLLEDIDVVALLAKQEAAKTAAWERFTQKYPRQARKMQQRLDDVAAAARGREAIRSEIVRLIWVIRAYALRAGELTGIDDGVFFLSADELAALLAGDKTAVSHIPARQDTHANLSALPPYPALISGRFDPHQWANDPQRRHDRYEAQATEQQHPEGLAGHTMIKGFPGAAGVVEGSVRRLDSLEEGSQLQPGEILVTATTNVGWTPLFPRAAAIITDVGAPLSHAAIVARELGIPAVVGCGNATMHLKTGNRVRVNGGQGTIEIITFVQ